MQKHIILKNIVHKKTKMSSMVLKTKAHKKTTLIVIIIVKKKI